MTAVTHSPVPAPESPAWRDIYPVPPQVRFDAGPWCPIDDTHLHSQMQTSLPGWLCPTCGAWWDQRGRNGQWITVPAGGRVLDGQALDVVDADPAAVALLRRVDRWTAAAIAATSVGGLVYAAGQAMRPHAHLVPNGLLLTLAGLLTAASAVVVAVALVLRWLDARRWASAQWHSPAGDELAAELSGRPAPATEQGDIR